MKCQCICAFFQHVKNNLPAATLAILINDGCDFNSVVNPIHPSANVVKCIPKVFELNVVGDLNCHVSVNTLLTAACFNGGENGGGKLDHGSGGIGPLRAA